MLLDNEKILRRTKIMDWSKNTNKMGQMENNEGNSKESAFD